MVRYGYLEALNDGRQTTSEAGLLESGESPIVEGRDGAEAMSGVTVTPNYFHVLGVSPARGRVFENRDLGQTGRPTPFSTFVGFQPLVGRSKLRG